MYCCQEERENSPNGYAIDICTPTVSSTMIDRIIVNTPFFGIFFYYSQWVFLVTFIIGFVVALFKRPRNNVDADLQELVDEEQEEHDSLLANKRCRSGGGYGSSSYRNNSISSS